jgi:hypothetical protein
MEMKMYRLKELTEREGILYLVSFLIVAIAVMLYVI